jgi:diketogulonate reductase-like aldo/keto reductase
MPTKDYEVERATTTKSLKVFINEDGLAVASILWHPAHTTRDDIVIGSKNWQDPHYDQFRATAKEMVKTIMLQLLNQIA